MKRVISYRRRLVPNRLFVLARSAKARRDEDLMMSSINPTVPSGETTFADQETRALRGNLDAKESGRTQALHEQSKQQSESAPPAFPGARRAVAKRLRDYLVRLHFGCLDLFMLPITRDSGEA